VQLELLGQESNLLSMLVERPRRGRSSHWVVAWRSGLAASLLLGRAAAQDAPAAAAPSHLAPTPSTAVSVKADARLTETAERSGIKAVFTGDGLAVSSCSKLCKTGATELRLVVPEPLRHLPRQLRVLELKGGQRALWAQYGSETEHYSLVLLGAKKGASDAPPGAPELVFRGQSAPTALHLSIDPSKTGHELYVVDGEPAQACGHKFPARARRLDAGTGQFAPVRLPPLSARERSAATELQAEFAVPTPGEVLLRLESQLGPSVVLDGDRIAPWKEPYGLAVVGGPLPSADMQWVVEFAQPLSEAATLHAASEGRVFAVHFAPQPGRSYLVRLPKDLGCVAWVQNAAPLPVVEIMGRLVVDPPPTIPTLVTQLNSADPGWAGSALGLLGQPAQGALLTALPLLTAAGQSRAVQVAAASPWGARVLAHALEFGKGPAQVEAARALESRGAQGAEALEAQLATAQPEAIGRLSELVFRIDQALGVRVIVQGLGAEAAPRRDAFRHVFRSLYADPERRPPFERQLFTEGGFQELNAQAKLAVLTSLSPTSSWPGLGKALAEAASACDFAGAYQLVNLIAPRAAELPETRTWLVQWMGTSRPPHLTATERAALRVHILQTSRERAPVAVARELSPLALPLLSDENVRVRMAAADFLAQFPEAQADEPLRAALIKDVWPAVRVSAADALGARLSQSVSEGRTETREQQVEFLRKRLKKEDEPRVRRAILSALASDPTEQVRSILRRSLVRDDSYQVRAEAAQLLGKLCDVEATEALTRVALQLSQDQVDDDAVRWSLSAVRALSRLAPADLDERIAPLKGEHVPGVLRVRIQAELTSVTQCSK